MTNQAPNSLKAKAVADLDSGKLSQALKKATLGIKKFPKDADYHAIAGFVLTEMKQYKKSLPHFQEAARLKPDDPQFVENIANALMQTGQIARALAYAEKMAEKMPGNREIVRVIDEITLKGKNWRSIIENATKRLMTDPDNPKLLSTRSRAYGRVGFVDAASADIARAYELDPDNIEIAFRRAVDLHQAGDKKGCTDLLWRVLDKDPYHASALFQLSSMVDTEQAEALLPRVEAAIAKRKHPNSTLEFTLAQLQSKIGGLEAALAQFAVANRVQHDENPYDFEEEERKLRRICGLFPDSTSVPSSGIEEMPLPIFVIGQPRSGTTLMEMMLSSAPDIAGCGELNLGSDLSAPYSNEKKAFSDAEAAEFAKHFSELMPPIPEGSIAFVDKMPHNYQRVGFLLAAFPNAKIINMLRDPRDVGLSKWIRRFPAAGMRYASNLNSIAHSANMYRRYMQHWDAIFGDRILTVPYEKLVADPETYSKQVAEFCGIEWRESMMHPEENKKQVRTASIDQVRKKISTKSVGGWRQVADFIRPMLDGFDPELWPEYEFD
ncbi:tetratricopeptide repeat-containing sulfotransferase family protein [Ruegeria sp. B32]|uniref:tetratricopeptide repeat-containing sulfotransferase family protein n=1 Tax=Ruegeria sp. B32 TaxID=2867020 RepID=UPI0021A83F1E|nr:tetratricopeptide repeat-containing sulfotransferase family protein [Ruegeria sp. B32]UWR06297.1 sulfotransferase [Ruegeria sp. B32]